ncbi:hypothetical protein [Companilactobacillus baiquanensis]|uniref:Integral membrane protein n=1 Tax=Companilactobacillus baiquanensis TaxID=2486005 RepID=A0ABW1UWW6_9LACO|nr:hypothetical protein [Companilactobacillus baiquanensis]
MQELLFVMGSLGILLLEKYVLANNSSFWIGAIVPIISIVFIVWLLATDRLQLDFLDILVSSVYISLSFIFWGQGQDLYHRRTVKKINKRIYE